MDIILLERIQNLGDLGDKVAVKSGFGRNFLIPSGKAVPATEANIAEFEAKRAEYEKAVADKLAAAEARKARVDGIGAITISHNAGDEGKLFGSVGTTDIANALTEAGAEVNRSEVRLPEGAFHTVGEFEVGIHLHADVDTTIKLTIVPEE